MVRAKRPGPGDVVVVTGASSGIGRATAHAFAERGASLVLAARSGQSLQETARECERRGGTTLAVPTDVGDEDAVRALVRAAVERFGRIDVWVNNASVLSYGTFEQTPSEVFGHVIQTNLFGQVYGARAVLPQFRMQGAGVLVNVASLYGRMGSPYLSPYVTSKFGLLGFSEVLRQELHSSDGIDVCTILPGSFDTPIYRQAANYTGREAGPVPPVGDPTRVAAAIVGAVERPRRAIVVGRTHQAASWVHAALPWLYDRAVGPVMDQGALRRGQVPAGAGTVFTPRPGADAVSGEWRQARRRLLVRIAVVAGVAAAGITAWKSVAGRRLR